MEFHGRSIDDRAAGGPGLEARVLDVLACRPASPTLQEPKLTSLMARCLILAAHLVVVPALAAAADAADEGARAAAFYERAQAEYFELYPEAAASLGLRIRYGAWNDRSEAGDLAGRELAERQLAQLRETIDRSKLDEQGRLSWTCSPTCSNAASTDGAGATTITCSTSAPARTPLRRPS